MCFEKSNDSTSTAGGRACYVDSLVIAREKKISRSPSNRESGEGFRVFPNVSSRKRTPEKSTRDYVKRRFGRFNDGFAQERKKSPRSYNCNNYFIKPGDHRYRHIYRDPVRDALIDPRAVLRKRYD